MDPLYIIGALVAGGAVFFAAYWLAVNIQFRRMNPVDRAELIRRISMKTDRGSLKQQGVGIIRAFVGYRGSNSVLAFGWLISFAASYAIGLAANWGLVRALFLAIPVSLLGLTIIVRRSARRMRIQFERQLMTAMPLISGQLESGAGKKRALERVVEVIEDPLRSEISQMLSKMEAGSTLLAASQELLARYPIPAMKLFVAAIEADENSSGGELAPILRAIAEGLERSFELRAEAQAEIAQSRYQFYGIVTGLAAIAFIMYNMGGPETKAAFASPIGLIVMIPILANAVWGVVRIQKLFNQAEAGTR